MLGFTYKLRLVHHPDPALNETWSTVLAREMNSCDLMMSYWAKNTERLAQYLFIEGHVDTSSVLIAKAPRFENPTLSERCMRLLVLWIIDGQLCACVRAYLRVLYVH